MFQQHPLPGSLFITMISRLLFLLLCWNFAVNLGHAQKLPGVKKSSHKVQINATSDTVVLKFLRPSPNIQFEGFILGYGGNFFSSQYIPLPENGKSYDTELDAEPRYMIAVRTSPVVNTKKTCSGQAKVQKPLQVVVGTLGPTSVFLAWGILINPQYDWTVLNNCPNDRFYTIRYREKEKNKKWLFQLCPNTETVIDNLKPNVIYEFGVKDNSEDGIWNKGVTHKTTVPPKHKGNGNGHMQSTIKEPKGHIQEAPDDTKMRVTTTLVKQVILNITNSKKPKSTVAPLLRTTSAVSDKRPFLPTSGTSEEPELPKTTESETATRQMTQEPPADITFISPEQPDSTPVSSEPTMFPFKDDISADSEVQESIPVPKDPFRVPSKPDTTVRPDVPKSKPVSKPTRRVPINLIMLHIDDIGATLVPPEIQKVSSSKPKTAETPRWDAVPNEIRELSPSKPKAPQATERPIATTAPKKPHREPINLIRLRIFGDSDMTSVPNETQTKPPSKPKPVHPTERPHSKAVPKPTRRAQINLIRLQIFDDPRVTLVPNETQKAPSSKPTSQTTEITHVKAASQKVHPRSSRPKSSARPRTRPVPNKTTPGTVRTKPSNDLNWISETAIGGKLTGHDNTKLLGVSRNTSLEPNGTVKRPVTGTQHIPLATARPTHKRRQPLPSNNVTGRPGISGNGLMPRASSIKNGARPTQLPIVGRTQAPKEKPTSAPEQETVTEPVFNPKPVSEIDALGKERYTAPHVKYMRKEDLVPCSITESMKHFPTELATNQDEAANAPQTPPSNLTVVAVEGCPSFVILDWEQPDNETVTEYKIISKENGAPKGKEESISTTNQTHSTVENLKPDTSYEFKVIASNVLGQSPPSTTVTHNTESADPRVSEPITGGKDAIWTEIKFKSDTYSECKGKQYVKRTWYKKFVGIQLCNSLRYKIYLSDSLAGKFYNIGDESGYGEDHCQFVDSFLDGRTGPKLLPEQLQTREGFYRSVRQQPVEFGKMGSQTYIRYVNWYECGTSIPGKW